MKRPTPRPPLSFLAFCRMTRKVGEELITCDEVFDSLLEPDARQRFEGHFRTVHGKRP